MNKPCPFCGGYCLYPQSYDEDNESWAIWCESCHCTVPMAVIDPDLYENHMEVDAHGASFAFDAWNNRKALTEVK